MTTEKIENLKNEPGLYGVVELTRKDGTVEKLILRSKSIDEGEDSNGSTSTSDNSTE